MNTRLQTFQAWVGSVRCVVTVCGFLVGWSCAVGLCADVMPRPKAVVTTQPKSWDQCTPADLVAVSRQLRRAGPQGRDSRALLVEHVGKLYPSSFDSGQLKWQEWLPLIAEVAARLPAPLQGRIVADIEKGPLADKVTARSVSPETWRTITDFACKSLEPARKAQWAELLHKAFLADAEGLASLQRRQDVEVLSAAQSLLGDSRASATAIVCVEKTSAWQAWSAADLEWLVGKLPAAEAERRRLTDQMMARLLSARKAAGSMSREDWQRLTVLVRPGLPPEQCSQLLEGMRGAFYGEACGFQSLDSGGYDRLVRAMKALGAKDEDVADLPVKFVLEKAVWRMWDVTDLIGLASAMGNGEDDKAKSARVLLFNHIQTKYLASESMVRSISCSQWRVLAQRLGGDVPKDVQADWAEKLRNAFANDPKAISGLTRDQVGDLAEAMRILGSPKAGVIVLAWMSSRPRSR
jgi:hypothetical protein